MKKNIWIMNHYASIMARDHGGRHYWFAKYLQNRGYNPIIFCANTIHNSEEIIDIKEGRYSERIVDGIKFVYIKTVPYQGNRSSRIFNMVIFAKNLTIVSKHYAKKHEHPDIILASSVHPLTLIAGEHIAKKMGVKCICEVRDLWPESIVAYGLMKRNSLLAKMLYYLEKRIYMKADQLIMTWEGGGEYIKKQGWSTQIPTSKIHHIPNGVDLSEFDNDAECFRTDDCTLHDDALFKIVYTGSIRKVNNLKLIISAAGLLCKKNINNVVFLIYGSGDELENLKSELKNMDINNVFFKGRVDKKKIPYILKKADINLLHNTSTSLNIYGQSQNKLFEYLAAGKPIVQTYSTNYSIIDRNQAGICIVNQTSEEISSAILHLMNNVKLRTKMGQNSRKAAEQYDFSILTDLLIKIIEYAE